MKKIVPIIISFLLTACGQTGPLYLPEPEPETIVFPTEDKEQ